MDRSMTQFCRDTLRCTVLRDLRYPVFTLVCLYKDVYGQGDKYDCGSSSIASRRQKVGVL
jgi:hypothetical protein